MSTNRRKRQRGVVTIEFALMLMLGLIPFLFLTFTGVMIFAAKQSLALAAAEGARATLRYGTNAERKGFASAAAQNAMLWLVNYNSGGVTVSVSDPQPCGSTSCYRVTTQYDYMSKPFLPMTTMVYKLALNGPLTDTAIVQLDAASAAQVSQGTTP